MFYRNRCGIVYSATSQQQRFIVSGGDLSVLQRRNDNSKLTASSDLPFGIDFKFDGMSLEDSLTVSHFRLNFCNEFLIVIGTVRVANQLSFSLEWRFLKQKRDFVMSRFERGNVTKLSTENLPNKMNSKVAFTPVQLTCGYGNSNFTKVSTSFGFATT